jgi:hypothetical protein
VDDPDKILYREWLIEKREATRCQRLAPNGFNGRSTHVYNRRFYTYKRELCRQIYSRLVVEMNVNQKTRRLPGSNGIQAFRGRSIQFRVVPLGSQRAFQGKTDVSIIIHNYNCLLGGKHGSILFLGERSAVVRLLKNRSGTHCFRAGLIENFRKRILFQPAKDLSACARD